MRQRLFVAPAEAHRHVYGPTTVAFRQQSDLQVTEALDVRACRDVLVRRLEGFSRVALFLRRVTRQHLRGGGRLRHHRAARRLVGDEGSNYAVVTHEILRRRGVDLCRRDVVELITGMKEQPPVAERNVLGKKHRERLGIGQCPFVGRACLLHRPPQFRGSRARLGQAVLDHFDHPVAHALDRLVLVDGSSEDDKAGLAAVNRVGEDLCRQSRLHEFLVEPAVGRVAEDLCGHADAIGVGVQA